MERGELEPADLEQGDLEMVGRLVDASNATFLVRLPSGGRAVYKPIAGERPLDDFPDGTLALRERAAYLLSEATGWRIVPATLLRDGPLGRGMVQAWVEVDESVDVVVSNCVLNLVEPGQKERLFREIHRVLKRGGRAVISDIVSDEPVPEELQRDPDLWSGCISGALTEDGFLRAFEEAGLYGIRVLERQSEPWQTVHGIEFRSLTVEAFKGKEGECRERNQAVVYRGPFKEVLDDDGHRMERGRRYAVCDKTYQIYRREPYRAHFDFVEPLEEIPLDEAKPFDCSRTALRHPRETKGRDYDLTTEGAGACCGPDGCC